jgi:hypothetical protein
MEGSCTEAGASVKPVIITKLIDLDSLLIRRRMRHGLCRHRQRLFRFHLGGQAIVLEEFGGEVEVLLERQLGVGLTGEEERGSQLLDVWRATPQARTRRGYVRRGIGMRLCRQKG